MNKLLSLTVLLMLGCVVGVFSQVAEAEPGPEPEAAPTLAQEVQYLQRNLTALWKVVRQLQAQVARQSHGSGASTHYITGDDHLDAARTDTSGPRKVHEHMHDGHLHLHEFVDGAPQGAQHVHDEHSHRHGDHFHFHEDIAQGVSHGQSANVDKVQGAHRHGDHIHFHGHHGQAQGGPTAEPDSASLDDADDDILSVLDEATN